MSAKCYIKQDLRHLDLVLLLQRGGNDQSFRRQKRNQSNAAFASPVMESENLYELAVVSTLRGIKCLVATSSPLPMPIIQRYLVELSHSFCKQHRTVNESVDSTLYKTERNKSTLRLSPYIPSDFYYQTGAAATAMSECLKRRPFVSNEKNILTPALQDICVDGDASQWIALYDYARHAIITVGLSWLKIKK